MDRPQQLKSAISVNKTSKALAEYLWDSPCLKPFFFNPFLLAILIILIVLVIDTFDGKYFEDTTGIFLLQHTFTTFVAISGVIVLNNMLIKHKYRQEKEELQKVIIGDNQEDHKEEHN